MKRAVAIAALASCMTQLPATLAAQAGAQATYVAAQRTVDRALAARSAGNLQGAESLLRGALADCGGAAEGAGCRGLIYFSLGYLLQSEAASTPEQQALLDRATGYYRRVEQEAAQAADPTEAARLVADATYNLSMLYRELGADASQEAHFRSAPDRDPGRRALHYTYLGDFHAQLQQWPQAVNAYRTASRDDPDGDAPRQGLVDAYRASGTPADADMLTLAREWEPRFPELAAHAYAAIIQRTYQAAPAAAEQALVRYVWVQASGQGVTDLAISRLPPDWRATRELEAYVQRPDSAPDRSSWWRGTEERARALARVGHAAGLRRVSAGAPADAERYWSAALGIVDAQTRESLDLKRELALLFFRHRDLDPDGAHFDRLEQTLFREKGGALAARDAEAAQRYHTVLGLIYAERNVWRSSATARNAITQLNWALETAALRDSTDGFRQPLPELRALLAAGYDSIGNTSAARAQYRAAALAFLDTDDLEGAASALPKAGTGAAVAPLRALLDHRAQLRAAGRGSTTAATLCASGRMEQALRGLARDDRTFVARQRFKLLVDCAEAGPAGRRAELAAEALVLVADSGVVLVGTGDVLRLENAAAAIRTRAVVPEFDAHVDFAPRARGTAVRVGLTSDTRAGHVDVPGDALVAARVIRLLGERGAAVRFQVRDGTVSFDEAAAGQLTPALSGSVSRLRGVTRVETTRRRY